MSLSALFGKNYFANVTWFVFISTLTLATKIYSIVCYFVVYSNKLTEIFYQFWTKTTNTLTNQIRLVPVWVFPLTSLNRCSIQFIKSVAWTRANLSAMAYNNIWVCYFFCSERRIYIYFFSRQTQKHHTHAMLTGTRFTQSISILIWLGMNQRCPLWRLLTHCRKWTVSWNWLMINTFLHGWNRWWCDRQTIRTFAFVRLTNCLFVSIGCNAIKFQQLKIEKSLKMHGKQW